MLQDYPQTLYLQTWISKFGYMYRDIQLIRTVMYIAMVLVIGVACFNIVSTLIMAVKDKAGDIAIMRTLGANNQFIKRIFILVRPTGRHERQSDWHCIGDYAGVKSHPINSVA